MIRITHAQIERLGDFQERLSPLSRWWEQERLFPLSRWRERVGVRVDKLTDGPLNTPSPYPSPPRGRGDLKEGQGGFLIIAGLSLLITLTSGCGITEPVRVEQDFGASVRQMIAAQTLDPVATATPDSEPLQGQDGRKAMDILQVYREDVPKPAEVPSIINISVGGR